MSNHLNSAEMALLNDQLQREKEYTIDLNSRLQKSIKELSDANSRENDLRNALSKKDKDAALVKHDLKESQRKVEQETDSKRKAERELAEMRKRLEDEQNRTKQQLNNHHAVSERITNLEKEKRDVTDRLKKEVESTEKLKKLNAEISVAKAASEASMNDLNDKLLHLTEDRNLLESELMKLQSHLQREQNQRNELSGQLGDSEARSEAIKRDLSAIQDREQRLIRENAELSSQKADLEKTKANLELEIRNVASKYEQMASNAPSSRPVMNRDVTDDLNNRTEQVKGLEAKLADEKTLRLRAEATIQDKDRELSMMAVDVRQFQYKLDKMVADLRQESDKSTGAIAAMERLKEEKSIMQSDLSVQASEITLLKTNEKRLLRDLSDHRYVHLTLNQLCLFFLIANLSFLGNEQKVLKKSYIKSKLHDLLTIYKGKSWRIN